VPGLERALPASYYLGPEAFARKRERVLYREWFCAGRADLVQRPGSLVVLDVAGESVLLVRTRPGSPSPRRRPSPTTWSELDRAGTGLPAARIDASEAVVLSCVAARPGEATRRADGGQDGRGG
jgi:hypothetical protein